MSFIVSARLLIRGCQNPLMSKCYEFTIPKLYGEKNLFKVITATTPIIQKRLFFNKENNYMNMDENIEHVYHGTLRKKIVLGKIFSYTTSMIAILTQPFIVPRMLETTSVSVVIFSESLTILFALGTPILLHLLTRKYILDIYYNTKSKVYIGTTFNIFLKEKKLHFTPSDVKQPELNHMLTTCFVKNRPILIDFHDFIDHEHYATIMNYDKPMDFKVANVDPLKIEENE